eukprot:NODE_402_length_8060_cov_0.986057.p2 type:complete len:399 gc:universal NODE_402_length_8060_cov_0.986057:5997-7193(+)
MDSDLEDDFTCAFCKGMISHDELPQDDFHQGNEANLENVAGLLKAAHKYHAAIGPMRLLLSNYHFKNKDEMIINFVKSCSYCKEKRKPKMTQMKFRMPKGVNEIVGIDLMEIDEGDYKYVAVIRDMFSGCTHLHPMINKSAYESTIALIKYCSKWGFPSLLVSDEGSEFLGKFDEFVKSEHIKMNKSHPDVKKENGIAERAIQTVQGMLRVIKKEYVNETFEFQLALCELFLNNTPRTSTTFSPMELMTLQATSIFNEKEYLTDEIRLHVQQQLSKIKQRQLVKRNENLREDCDYKVGDKVWFYPNLKSKKLRQLAYLGTIVRVIRDKQFELIVDGEDEKTFRAHSDQLLMFANEFATGDCDVGIDLVATHLHHLRLRDDKEILLDHPRVFDLEKKEE